MCKGYSPVEFFFLTSGFFLYRLSVKDVGIIAYFKSRVLRLYPAYLISLILYIILLCDSYSIFDFIYELSLMQGCISIPEVNCANRVVWYVSVLVWGGFFVFLLLKRTKSTILLLGISLFIYFMLLGACGSFDDTFSNWGIIHLPFWRGIAGLLLGACLSKINDDFNNNKIKDKTFSFIWIIGIVAFILSLILMFLPYKTEFLSLLCYCIVLLACMSSEDKFSRALPNITDITYEMFLLHLLIIKITVKSLDMVGLLDLSIMKYITYFMFLIAVSYLYKRFIKYLMSLISRVF